MTHWILDKVSEKEFCEDSKILQISKISLKKYKGESTFCF